MCSSDLYKHRTRSGCATCPFQRVQELVGLLQYKGGDFDRGATYETVSEGDLSRWSVAKHLSVDTGSSLNWLSLPMPQDAAIEKGRQVVAKRPDLFGMRVYVGGEFFMDGFLSNDEFCWHQRIVSFSTELHQIRRQLNDRYRHLLSTAEVYGMTTEEVREKVKFAVWYVQLPAELFDPLGPKDGGYTWRQGTAYAQIKHVISWVTRALQAEQVRREAAVVVSNELSVQYEWQQNACESLTRINEPVGEVILSEWYKPDDKPPVEDEEEVLINTPCPLCHI